MIVGFTITDFNGHEDDAVEFIRKVCILESPDIAENIVLAGAGSVNVFTSAVTLQELQKQPFSCTPIETQDGKYLVASAVNFFLELTYNNTPLGLQPTEYLYVEPEELPQFYEYYRQGLVRTFPDIEIGLGDSNWILAAGYWNDGGEWIDGETWRDN